MRSTKRWLPPESRNRHRVLGIALAVSVVAAYTQGPIPQDPGYHRFADERTLVNVANALNVLSNLPFAIVGIAGLALITRSRRAASVFDEPWERWPYVALFGGAALTTFGSAYYHLAPDNARLVWDRLPMTIGFMGLLTAVIAERVGIRPARRLFVPLLLVGAISVVYWYWSEARGAGDLRLYAVVQFGSLLGVILLLLLYRSRYAGSRYLVTGLVLYGVAKLFELGDRAVYDAGGLVSGHTLKHLVAAASVGALVAMLRSRRGSVDGAMLPRAIAVACALAAMPATVLTEQNTPSVSFTRAEQEQLLLTGTVSPERGPAGRTGWRVTLDDGTRKHDGSVEISDGSDTFQRHYRLAVAAYALASLISLDLVAPTVERVVGGRPAAVTWWIDGVLMNELTRRRKNIDPPDRQSWDRQIQGMRLFDELAANAYRDVRPEFHTSTVWDNLIITRDWQVWLTDHTRTFRNVHQLDRPETLTHCDRAVLARLRQLDRAALQEALGKYLDVHEIEALDIRRTLLLKHFAGEIDRRGEAAVLYDLPRRR